MSFVVNPFNPLKLIETGWKYILHGKTDSENGGPICTRGLKNIGNTCFLNCVLQAVSSCPLFVAHINAVANDPESGLFVNQLNRCVVDLRRGGLNSGPVNPNQLLKLLALHNPEFGGFNEQDALEAFESILSCLKEENDELIKGMKERSWNKMLNITHTIIPSKLLFNAPTDGFHKKIESLICPFEGWISSQLQCQVCKKEAGEQALRWMPSRNQVFTTLPLPIAAPAPVRTTTNNNSSSSTEEAAGDEVVKLKGGNLMEDGVDLGVRQSSHAWSGAFEQQQHQQYQQLTPTIYSCLQEYFRAEELSGISCSACSTAGTLANMQRQLSVAQRKVVRETAASEKPMRDTELPVLALPDNWTSTVIAEAMESLKKLRVVGASDALIQDFDSGFLKIISPLTNKVETIKRSAVGLRRHQEGGTGGSPNSIATPPGGFCSPAVSTQSSSDRELLLLSLKAQAQSEAVKRTALSRLPPLLCLSLCRRVYDESKGKMKKILQHVSFPVILHMDQFCGITGVGVDASAIGRKEAQDQAPAPVSITSILSGSSALQRGRGMRGSAGLSSGFSYKLRAVVEHRGNAETGHYVAYCLVAEQPQRVWELFSDERHTKVNEADVLAAQATLLFYDRVQTL